MSLLAALLACAGSDPSGDTGTALVEVDADGDGYPAWDTTTDDARADCDDADPDVTPLTERYVRAGPFTRGSDDLPWASPVRTITLSDYCIDVTEVTNTDFLELLEAREADGYHNVDDEGRTLFDLADDDDVFPQRITWIDDTWGIEAGYERHPVVEVWYSSAELYCASVGRAMPTEAQWEKAARGDQDARKWPWGDDPPDCGRANYAEGEPDTPPTERVPCVQDTTPVDAYPDGISPYGVMDMSGNVAEWVYDWFAPDEYASDPDTDPTGPAEGEEFYDGVGTFVARINHGGTFLTTPDTLEAASRTPEPEEGTSNGVGFRCARPLSR
jgi:formylglycine-generating enzyme required for sulfatase activity